jgi:hypothetical protein
MPISSADIASSNARDAQDKTMVLATALIWVLENMFEGPAVEAQAKDVRDHLLDVFYQLKWKRTETSVDGSDMGEGPGPKALLPSPVSKT